METPTKTKPVTPNNKVFGLSSFSATNMLKHNRGPGKELILPGQSKASKTF
jgi:hypothetical protein